MAESFFYPYINLEEETEPTRAPGRQEGAMQYKQILVLRKDLKMRKGKMITQGAHAALQILLDNGSFDPERGFSAPPDPVFAAWLDQGATKITVSVDSEEELLEICNRAKDAGIRCALIEDAGRTEFNGRPTLTCCALGPAEAGQLDPITGTLPLL